MKNNTERTGERTGGHKAVSRWEEGGGRTHLAVEDGLPPGPSKDPLTVLAGEHGVLGEVGEGGGEGLGYCEAEQEEDSVDHVIVIPPPLTPL